MKKIFKKKINSFFRFNLSNLYLILLLIGSVLSSSCNQGGSCLSGDNFDGENNTFNSFAVSDSEVYYDNNKKTSPRNNLIRWEDTKLKANGENIVLQVSGRWSPWGEAPMQKEKIEQNDIGEYIITQEPIEKECKNFSIKKVETFDGSLVEGDFISLVEPVGEYPCWLTKGKGLYLLFQDENSKDPNSSLEEMKEPGSYTIHLADLNPDQVGRIKISSLNGIYDGYGDKFPIKKGMKIYAKIYDSYYLDNYGEYSIDFLSGIMKSDENNFFNQVYIWIIKDFFENIKNIFNDIISQKAYKNALLTMMLLYISVVSLAFLMGFIKAQIGELTLRLLKVGLVFIMLSPNAWNFFNDNLFTLYFDGVNEIISIAAGEEKNFDKDKPFVFLDRILNQFFSDDVWGKRLPSLLNANYLLGVLWISIISIILLFMFVMFLYCFCVYILGIIVLGFLTIMLPIFIVFILFNFTRNFFNEWVNVLFSNSFKIIMTFITLIFFANIIEMEIKRTIGYKTCEASVMNFDPLSAIGIKGTGLSIINQYAPGEAKSFRTMNLFTYAFNILFGSAIGPRFKFTPNIVSMLTPPFYDELGYRYQSLPFLDPNTKKQMDVAAYNICALIKTHEACHPDKIFPQDIGEIDHNQIKDMMFSNSTTEFVYFWRLFAMLICLIVLWVIGIYFIESIAEYIAIGGEGLIMPNTNLGGSIQGMHNRYMQQINKLSQSKNTVFKGLGKGLMLGTTAEGFFLRQTIIGNTISKATNNIDNLVDKGINRALSGMSGGAIGGENESGGIFKSLVDNFRYFDSTSGPSSTKSEKSFENDNKQDEINMSGLNRLRDTLGLFIEGVGKTTDNIQSIALFNAVDPLSHSLKTAKLGVAIAKNAINYVSGEKLFLDTDSSEITKHFDKLLFDAKLFGEDASKILGVDKDHRIDRYMDTMDNYYSNLQRVDEANKKELKDTFEDGDGGLPPATQDGINVGNFGDSPILGGSPDFNNSLDANNSNISKNENKSLDLDNLNDGNIITKDKVTGGEPNINLNAINNEDPNYDNNLNFYQSKQNIESKNNEIKVENEGYQQNFNPNSEDKESIISNINTDSIEDKISINLNTDNNLSWNTFNAISQDSSNKNDNASNPSETLSNESAFNNKTSSQIDSDLDKSYMGSKYYDNQSQINNASELPYVFWSEKEVVDQLQSNQDPKIQDLNIDSNKNSNLDNKMDEINEFAKQQENLEKEAKEFNEIVTAIENASKKDNNDSGDSIKLEPKADSGPKIIMQEPENKFLEKKAVKEKIKVDKKNDEIEKRSDKEDGDKRSIQEKNKEKLEQSKVDKEIDDENQELQERYLNERDRLIEEIKNVSLNEKQFEKIQKRIDELSNLIK